MDKPKLPSLFFLLHFPDSSVESFLDGDPINDVIWRYEGKKPGQWQVVTDEDTYIFENQLVDFDAGAVIKDIQGGQYYLTLETRTELDSGNWAKLLGPDRTDEVVKDREAP